MKWCLVITVVNLLAVSVSIQGHRNATDCTPRDHLPCTVVKTECLPDVQPPPEEGWPSKPKDLNVTTYMKEFPKYLGTKYPCLNFTWRIPDDISYKYVKGFKLTATVMSGKHVGKQLCRHFNLSTAHWNRTDLKDKVTFYYDRVCPCLMKTTYYIQLYSLPKSATGHSDNFVYQYVVTPGKDSLTNPNPANWVTAMNFDIDTASSRVDVWFKLAPPGYRFVQYDVMLINATPEGGRMKNQWIRTTVVTVREGETGIRHVPFLKVCTGNYTVYVQPRNTGKYSGDCVCKMRDGTCAEFCDISSSSIFTFVSGTPCHVTTKTATTTSSTTSKISPTIPPSIFTFTRTSPTPHLQPVVVVSTSSSQLTMTDSGDLSRDKIAAIIIGVVVGVLLIAVLVTLIIRRKWCPGPDNSCFTWRNEVKPPVPAANLVTGHNNMVNTSLTGDMFNSRLDNLNKSTGPTIEGVEISHKLRVLLVYSNDHPHHLNVVHHLAQFLNANCGCDVRFDQWSLDEIHCRSYVTWLWQEIDCAERIIIVNSQGAYCQNEAHKQNATYNNVAEDSPPEDDGFLVAMDTIKNRFGKTLCCSYEKLIMVYFPYTSESHVLRDINPAQRYKLMKHIEDVVLHLHGLQRFNPDSVQFIGGGVNYEQYYELPWGEPLVNSINKMTAYVNSRPNWFDQRFTLVRSDSGFSSDGIQMDNLSESPQAQTVFSVVPPQIDGWSGNDISEFVENTNKKFDEQLSMDYESVNPSILDDCSSIGGTSI